MGSWNGARRCWLVLGGLAVLAALLPAVSAQDKMDQVDPQAVAALLAEETAEGRARVLTAHPGLLSRDAVFAVLKRGEDAVNAGQHAAALRACDAAEEIAARARLDPFTLGICGMMRGTLLGHISRHQEAIKTLEAARPLVQQGKNPAIEAMLVVDLAKQYEELGQVDKAKTTYDQALQLARGFGKARSLEAEILGKLGALERRRGNLQAAMEMLDQALKLAREAGQEPLQASLLLNIGFLLDDLGKTAQALAYHQQALAIHKKNNNRAGTISALNACAMDAKNLGRFREAAGLYEEALARAEAIRSESLVATLKDNLGTVLRLMGRWDQGVQLHEQALAIFERLQQPAGKQLVLNHLGIACRAKGDVKAAVDYYHQALDLARSLQAPAEESAVLVNLGNAYSELNRHEDAITCYRQSLAIQERLGNPRAIAAALMNLANEYKQLQRYDSQKQLLNQARDKAREARDPLTEAAALQALAGIEARAGDKARAVAMAEEALGLVPEDASERVYGLLELAMRRMDVREYDVAVRHAEAAAEAARKTSQPKMQTLALLAAGMLRLPQERDDPAVPPAEAAPAPPPPTAPATTDLAGAVQCLSEAVELAELLDDWQLTWLAYYFRAKAHAALGDDERKLEGYLAAAKAIGRQRELGWTPSEREWFAERPVRLYRLIALEYLRRGQTAEAFRYAELAKAQIMLESMSARHLVLAATRRSPELDLRRQGALQRLGELDALLRRERLRPEQQRDEELIKELRGKREETEDELRRIKGELQRQSPAYADLVYPQPPALDAACAALAPGTALVEYIVESGAAAALVLSREGAASCRLDATGKELAQQVEKLQEAIGAAGRSAKSAAPLAETDRLAGQLYRSVFEPVRRLLPAGIGRVVVVPDGPLHLAPFAALGAVAESPAGASARYLCEDYCLSYAPSATVLLELRARKSPAPKPDRSQIVAVCDPAYAAPRAEPGQLAQGEIARRSASSWSRLAAAAGEAKEIRSVWGERATVLTQAEATEQGVKDAAGKAACLHFATHAYLDPASPLYSAIVLAPDRDRPAQDAYLQAYEVCEMDLDGSLAVLSACETARGTENEGEGLMGLSRAFFLAGSRAVVATLWQVDDEATSVLGAEFHRRLKEGQPVSVALREAQLAMLGRYDRGSGQLRGPGRNRPRESVPAEPAAEGAAEESGGTRRLPPFYWAAFGVYGDPRAVLTPDRH